MGDVAATDQPHPKQQPAGDGGLPPFTRMAMAFLVRSDRCTGLA